LRIGFERLLKKSEKQIPHRQKPVRDDKNKGLATAHPSASLRAGSKGAPLQKRVEPDFFSSL